MKKKTEEKSKIKSDLLDHKLIESKWQKIWQEQRIYQPDLEKSDNHFYNLMMFPYPSAEGLHVGNMYAFCGSDIYGRYMRMRGSDVFEPIGLDGFGIHSENYAMKIGKHPARLATQTAKNFYSQLQQIGNAYSWGNKLETYDPNYYKWTQWIFIELFKAGLAYRSSAYVNWCNFDKTVLADEQVLVQQVTANKKQSTKLVCERCGNEVVKKELTQWFFRITEYAERLLSNLDNLDWDEKIKTTQRNWLGKSEGVSVLFQFDLDESNPIEVFTTRLDTIFGVTYIALAPDHRSVIKILNNSKGQLQQDIQKYVDDSLQNIKNVGQKHVSGKKERGKTGVFTNTFATHPMTGKRIPIYISDYVLSGYGTGAVMGVPAHDERDWDFASLYHIDVVEVVKQSYEEAAQSVSRKAFTGKGVLINSNEFNGMKSDEAIKSILKYIKEKHLGTDKINWHLRDWIISRQRYWGPPIPMIYCEACAKKGDSWFSKSDRKNQLKISVVGMDDWASDGWYPVPDADLPVELPFLEDFKPSGTGDGPLIKDKDFVNVKCPGCGLAARRETDVSDTFLDSSWYFLRYPSVTSSQSAWNKEITKSWLPVDMYIGGAEHAVLHLLYSRFITMVFHDLGLLDFEEPFSKFRAHGLLIKDGAKMSKSKGNVVNPDDYINKFGADTLRCYLMFCGRFDQGGDFRDTGIEGMSRFLKRIFRLFAKSLNSKSSDDNLDQESLEFMNKTIKKVTQDIEGLSYNTAIAAMMEWLNFLESKAEVGRDEMKNFLLMLAPFAPFMTEELWQELRIGEESLSGESKKVHGFQSIHKHAWPKFDPRHSVSSMIELIVQINGKVRDKILAPRGLSQEEAMALVKKSDKAAKYLADGSKKVVYVPDRLISLVV